jgi:hypothetical protein
VTVGHEDVAVLRNSHCAGRLKVTFVVARHARLAEREQNLAVRAELDDLMARLDAGLGRERHALRPDGVRHPDVAFLVDEEAVRPDEHTSSEALDDPAIGGELEDGIQRLDPVVRTEAVEAEPASGGYGHRAGFVTSNRRPDALAVDVDVDRSGRAHLAPAWELRPVAAGHTRPAAIGEPLHGTVRIGQPGLGVRARDHEQSE